MNPTERRCSIFRKVHEPSVLNVVRRCQGVAKDEDSIAIGGNIILWRLSTISNVGIGQMELLGVKTCSF